MTKEPELCMLFSFRPNRNLQVLNQPRSDIVYLPLDAFFRTRPTYPAVDVNFLLALPSALDRLFLSGSLYTESSRQGG